MISFVFDGIEYRVYDHLFAVSRCGKVLRGWHPYSPRKHPQGYLQLGRKRLMHRVVAKCWVPGYSENKLVHHINGIKDDNRAENLECVTAQEHMGDRHHGLNGHYIRTPETIEKLRAYRTGRKDSEETRAKKAAQLNEVVPRRGAIFNGVRYRSVTAAAQAARIPIATFRVRCASKNFPEYELDPPEG